MGRVTLQFAALESDIMLSIHLLLADSFKDSDSKCERHIHVRNAIQNARGCVWRVVSSQD